MVTGHSLGAGTAALLAIILRKNYPNLHCYAFGTPGSVVDPQTAQGTAILLVSFAPVKSLLTYAVFRMRGVCYNRRVGE